MSNIDMKIKFAGQLIAVVGLFSLGACATNDPAYTGGLDDVKYTPVSVEERYPIKVTTGTVKLNVPTSSAHLTAGQSDAIRRFAQQARESGADKVYIARPAGSMYGDVIAGKVTQIFASEGVRASRLRHSTVRARAGAPVTLSFSRKFAETRKCGNYPKDFTSIGRNEAHPDFGCSVTHNLAAMVANPQDFLTPRTMTPSDPTRRHRMFEDYRTPKSPTTPEDSNSKVSTTDTGKN